MRITSEKQAWTLVKRYAARISGSTANQEARTAIDAVADTMLEQLGTGIHANPSIRGLDYARALGGRIRQELNGTAAQALADRVTHHIMTGRADLVKTGEAQKLAQALDRFGARHVARQWVTFWNRQA